MNLFTEDGESWDGLNVTEREPNATGYLEEVSEPSKPYRDPLYVVVPITVLYAAIFLTGIVGNVSTCIVIARNKHMHTATNYYLFSLAISDLLLLVSGLPPEMFFMWRKHSYVFGETFCVLQSFAAETSANATVLTITAFTIERYVAICHPFQSHTLSKLSRAVRFVIAIWVSALGLAIPQAIQYGVVTVVGATGPASVESYCTLKKVLIPNAFLISICVFFVIPMTVITVLYVLIGLKLRRSRLVAVKRPSPNRDASKHRTATSQSHVIRMLVAVVVGFFICWAPFHAQRLVAMYGHLDEHPSKTVYIVYIFLTYISGVLYYLSTTINPLLYHIMSHKFRNAFKTTLVQLCSGKTRKNGGKRKLYLSLLRPNNRKSFEAQNPVNLVSFRSVKAMGKQQPSNNGNLHEAAFVVANDDGPGETTVQMQRGGREEEDEVECKNPKGEEVTQETGKTGRDSFTSSRLTLVTSCSKMDDEGNNNNTNKNLNNRRECRGKTCQRRRENEAAGTKSSKCSCWDCEKNKRGISSLTNRCLYQSIATKIHLLPSRNKQNRDKTNKTNRQQPNKKFKLVKRFSSLTISNSSLQDLDESEFTSSELADIMGQLKYGQEVQV